MWFKNKEMNMTQFSRRDFLKSIGTTSASAAAATPVLTSLLAMQEAAAAVTPGGYKALVCVYMAGGNDAYNTLVPFVEDSVDRNTYLAKRSNISLAINQLIPLGATPLDAGNTGMALNKRLSTLADWYHSGRLAVVANVGPLKLVSDKSQESQQSLLWPGRLYSHNDQTSVWLTGELEGKNPGWGGGIANARGEAVSDYAAPFKSISMGKQSAFCVSPPVVGFAADTKDGITAPGRLWGNSMPDTGIDGAFRPDANFTVPVFKGYVGKTPIAGAPAGHVLEQDYISKMAAAYDNWAYLKIAPADGSPRLVSAEASGSDLWRQLSMVANYIKSSAEIGLTRQVFFVEFGAFDTHSGQTRSSDSNLNAHDTWLADLNQSLGLFYEALAGYEDNVTTFTASEFGRKLLQNGDGTDHGWGGHHFVMGGSQVKGGKIYGRVPSLALTETNGLADPQLLADGTMVPEVSVDQFGWELAQWFGVPANDATRKALFPNYFAPKASLDISFVDHES
jgi:uncharacterized protein (DUF1501 family)